MELERLGDKLIVHNYGHGGSGITLCWGAARLTVESLRSQAGPCAVAVLGAGVMGLCTARLLLEAGYRVTVYAREFPPHTTSNIAGGLWAPTHIGDVDRRILEWSWRKFQQLEGRGYGVYPVKLYETAGCPYPLDPLPDWLLGEGEPLERLPLARQAPPGVAWNTYVIETDTFLDRLCQEIREHGGALVERPFHSLADLLEMEEEMLVNCLGLGAGTLCGDEAVIPIRGQLLYMKPFTQKFVLDHPGGYIISRGDKLILGGSFEVGVRDTTPSAATTAAILKGHRSFPWD